MSSSNVTVSVPSTLDFNATIGALEIGVFLAAVLFGILLAQMYWYILRFPDDPIILKALVFLVGLLELAHIICDAHALYSWTILDFGDLAAFLRAPDSIKWTIIISGCISTITQGFFAWRILRFSKQWYIPIICWTLSLFVLVACIFTTVHSIRTYDVEGFTKDWGGMLTSILTVCAFTDILITVSLSYYLRKERGDGYERTTRLVDMLVRWTVETGLLTSMSAIVIMICFQAVQQTFVWIGVFALSAGLYANSFLALLNARTKIRTMMRASTVSSPIDVESGNFPPAIGQFARPAKIHHSHSPPWSTRFSDIGAEGFPRPTSEDFNCDNKNIQFGHAL